MLSCTFPAFILRHAFTVVCQHLWQNCTSFPSLSSSRACFYSCLMKQMYFHLLNWASFPKWKASSKDTWVYKEIILYLPMAWTINVFRNEQLSGNSWDDFEFQGSMRSKKMGILAYKNCTILPNKRLEEIQNLYILDRFEWTLSSSFFFPFLLGNLSLAITLLFHIWPPTHKEGCFSLTGTALFQRHPFPLETNLWVRGKQCNSPVCPEWHM